MWPIDQLYIELGVLLLSEVKFFPFFLLLKEIRRVMSGKMASNQLKTLQKFDLDSFQGIA